LHDLASDKYKIDFIDIGEKISSFTEEAVEEEQLKVCTWSSFAWS
jgi:hypothetical protein